MRFFFAVLYFLTLGAYSQVGVGTVTPDPSSVLDVQSSSHGVLVPRLSNANRSNIVSPAQGLIIFNTDTKSLQNNIGTPAAPIWGVYGLSNSTKYSNTDTTTDLSGTNVPIFGNLNWNDNTSLFQNISSTELRVLATGRYEIRVNIYLTFSSNRGAIEMQIYQNGSPIGSHSSVGYLNSTGATSASINISEIVELNANDVITIATNGVSLGSIRMKGMNSSNFYISKVR